MRHSYSLAGALAVAMQLTAQSPIPTQTSTDRPGDALLLYASRPGTPIDLPGIAGPLQLHLPTLSALSGFSGFGPELVPLLQSLTAGTFSYQQLDKKAEQLVLSRVASISLGADFEQQSDLAACTRRATRFLDSVRGTLAPSWTEASIGAARPMYRPDVRGVAYYEFAVRPEGFLVVATGDHDQPIAHWNDAGLPIAQELDRIAAQASTAVAKVYKLDTLCYAAVDANGRLIGNVGSLPPKLIPDAMARGGYRLAGWPSFAELEMGFTAAYKPMIENLRLRAAPQWQAERQSDLPIGPQDDWSPWYYHWAGSHADQRLYNQYAYGGCVTGCGPTAWAMLFGWVDLKAAQLDARWRYRTGFYREGGSVYGNAAVIAPSYVDYGVRNMIQELRGQVNTFCLAGNGATYPWQMGDAQYYLNPRTSGRVVTDYSSVGIHYDSLRDQAIVEISSNRTPAVIGTGWLSHYPVAYGYAYRYRTAGYWPFTYRVYSRWFYVNQGWGGSGNGWVEASTWFAGRVFPS